MAPSADTSPDLEKGSRPNDNLTNTSTTDSSSFEDRAEPVLEPIKTAASVRSRHSSRSRRSAVEDDADRADLYETLSRAMTADQETDAEREAREPIQYTRTGASLASTTTRPPEFEVIFEDGDPENPRNWSLAYRAWVMGCVSFASWVIVLYSTSYTASTPGLMKEFDASLTVTTLGITTYLLGLAVGCLVLAPLSELWGRQRVYVVCLTIWLVLIIPCGLATSLTEILVVRFVGALFGSAMISNGPGSVVDISHPDYLALSMSLWGIAPLNGPVTGPLIGGFVYEYLGWRWESWVALIIGGVATALMLTLKETYAPAILKRKAARLRKENDDPRYWCQYDQKVSTMHLMCVNLRRPFVLFWTEPILWFMNLWVSVVYGILYLCFVAYPIVFSEHRGWSAGMSGLAFCGIGIGILLAIVGEPLLRRIILSQPRDPATGRPSPEATALIMAIGAVLTPAGQLAFSWTCLPTSIHWAVPMFFSVPFGIGNTLCFIYASQYLASAYGIYAASALAGNALLRSLFGAALPLAGPKMYEALTPQWAGTLLGLLEVALIPVPLVLWRYGHKIRAKSPTIRMLKEEQDRLDAKRAKGRARMEKRRQQQQQQQEQQEQRPDSGRSDESKRAGGNVSEQPCPDA